jgi:chemotaxis-related protein WspD
MNRDEQRKRAAGRCWATIGALGGDRSCAVLRDVHCRECEVLVLAADDLLAIAPRGSDRGPALVRETAQRRLVMVTFEVGGHALALEVSQLVEVGAQRPVRRLPHRPGPIFAGLVNVKGRLEPCFSLAAALGLREEAPPAEPRLVVIGRAARACAFHVAKLSLLEIDAGAVGDPPATVTSAFDTHVRGVLQSEGRSWAWLDSERLMTTLERSLG